jgi:hypothetical protein
MAKGNRVVIFSEYNAREEKGIQDSDLWQYELAPNVVVNPDLKAVEGLHRHYWKMAGKNKIVPMTASERRARDLAIQAHTDEIGHIPKPVISDQKPTYVKKYTSRRAWMKILKLTGTLGGGAAFYALFERLWG